MRMMDLCEQIDSNSDRVRWKADGIESTAKCATNEF